MSGRLENKHVAILATDGFEQIELFEPMEALKKAGATVEVIAPKGGIIQGFNHFKADRTVAVDKTLDNANAADYDALVLPGGAHNPDQLRIDEKALHFVRSFAEAGKPMGVICHAPWILINAGLARGRKLTSWRTIRQDLTNAGATVVDREVVVDAGLVTSRGPDDLPAFCRQIVEEFAKGPHPGASRRAARPERRPDY